MVLHSKGEQQHFENGKTHPGSAYYSNILTIDLFSIKYLYHIMSFGIGIGDILKVSELAYRLWKACTESATEISELSGQLSTLHRLLKALILEVENPFSLLNRRGGDRIDDFVQILGNLEVTLLQVERIVKNYRWIGTGNGRRRIMSFIGFAIEDLSPLREKLVLHLTAIATLYDTLYSGSLARIEDHVEVIKQAMSSSHARDKLSVEQQLRDAKIIPENSKVQVKYEISKCAGCKGGSWQTCPECAGGRYSI